MVDIHALDVSQCISPIDPSTRSRLVFPNIRVPAVSSVTIQPVVTPRRKLPRAKRRCRALECAQLPKWDTNVNDAVRWPQFPAVNPTNSRIHPRESVTFTSFLLSFHFVPNQTLLYYDTIMNKQLQASILQLSPFNVSDCIQVSGRVQADILEMCSSSSSLSFCSDVVASAVGDMPMFFLELTDNTWCKAGASVSIASRWLLNDFKINFRAE
jgi:hypothetical protein